MQLEDIKLSEVNRQRIDSFQNRFTPIYGEGHFIFACHAAFLVIFTPDMLHRIWLNFNMYPGSNSDEAIYNIHNVAVSDLLLSNICKKVGVDLYEMEKDIRSYLLKELKKDQRFGQNRLELLADFLYQYAEETYKSPWEQNLKNTHQWTALAVSRPQQAVEQIAKTLARAIEEKNTGEQLRLFLLIDTFAKEENAFDQLFQFSKGIKEHIYGNIDYTVKMPVLTRTPDAEGISLLTLPIPKTLRGKIKQGISDINKEISDRIKEAKEKNLTALHLDDLEITNIPGEVFQLKQLELLNLRDNNLDYIPTAISQLYNLRILDFSKNRLKKLPVEITQLSQLKKLLLKNNQLSKLPAGISKLRNLEFLDLSDNQLTQLPEELIEFELDFIWTGSLTILDKGIILTNNPFKTPPVEIVKKGKETVKQYFLDLKKKEKIDITGLRWAGNIYRVTISPTQNEGIFHITWYNVETNTHESFEQSASEITPDEVEWFWKDQRNQLRIGEKLFRFLDGDLRHLQRALYETSHRGESLQINLTNCRETKDWPFELLSKDGSFLLPYRMHLVRTVSDWGKERYIVPKNRPLKMLFMACSPFDVKPELDFEREEEALFQATEGLTLDMEVEDSGSLEGLRWQLQREQYDVVHLSGHSAIDEHGRPFFIMEDETGSRQDVGPENLWRESLIENPPRLLFLSGSSTGEKSGSGASVTFARELVENYNMPAILGWGRPVSDQQAIYAAKFIYQELSRGKSIIEALQRARYELLNHFSTNLKPAWPLLRLFSSGVPLKAIVTKNQRKQPLHRQMKHIFLENSQVKVLAEGFVGRRRQLQRILRVLRHDFDKVGVLILGTGGLGKSCLAGKICERLTGHTVIIVHGRLNEITLAEALKDAFTFSLDEKGQQILAQQQRMADKLAMLCATSFKERNYLIILDDFDQNLEGAMEGLPGALLPGASDLLKTLLHYLPYSGKMTQLIITCRYEFSLTEQNRDLAAERLEKVWLTGFHGPERWKKAQQLKNVLNYADQSQIPLLLSAGCGNPRLMEWLDVLLGQMKVVEVPKLVEAIKDKQEDFIREHVIRQLLQGGEKDLALFLQWFSIYRRPVLIDGVRHLAEKTGFKAWEELLKKGIGLSLIEYDRASSTYQLTPLLREELLTQLKDTQSCHQTAYEYYEKRYEPMEVDDAVLLEELIYHALGCGEEDIASKQGGRLVEYLRERLAFLESRRVGEWVLAGKNRELCTRDDASLLNSLASTIADLGNYRKAIEYYEQALAIDEAVFGKEHPNVAVGLNNLGEAWRVLGEPRKAIEYFEVALTIDDAVFGREHPNVARELNNLGQAWDDFGDSRKAIEYYEKALKINIRVFGKKHPNVAVGLNNLGEAWRVLGELRKAIDYYEQALTIDKTVFGKEHPNVAVGLNNLGEAWNDLGDHSKAIEYYEKALSIWKDVYGDEHPHVATALNNLGWAWADLGESQKAIDYYQKALAIDKEAFGPEHPDVARELNNLGTAFFSLGQREKAKDYFEQAYTIFNQFLGPGHPHTKSVTNWLEKLRD